MKIGDILGSLVGSGMSPSSEDRMRNSMGGGGILDGLAGILGGGSGESSAGPLSGLTGGGGLGGALGGGVMALLGTMAFKALKGVGGQKPQVPLGLMEPRTDAERQELEHHSELILKAMLNAAKADGRIDENEIRRIIGKLQETGMDAESQQYVMTEMQKPMETQRLIAAAQGRPELATEMYAASLLAIEVDTPAEQRYLDQLAAGLGLHPQVTQRIHEMVGLQPAEGTSSA